MKENIEVATQDPVYPIAHWHVSWTYKDAETGERKNNGTGGSLMRREDFTLEEFVADHLKWWAEYDRKGDEPSEPVWIIEPVVRQTWCLRWFSHVTPDIGQSDEEVLASFERFVTARERENLRAYKERGDGLMGAEDRFRWCGSADGSSGMFGVSNRSEAPCRCDGCKKNGVVMVCH